MSRAFLGLILVLSGISLGVLWLTKIPLGIPGEWTWTRVTTQPDTLVNVLLLSVAAGFYLSVVRLGWRRFRSASFTSSSVEVAVWLAILVAISFTWIWIVQEGAPPANGLGKAPFVLYYPSSSGYFTRARYDSPKAGPFLSTYEDLMREGDVLHVGTHPPGLFLFFHGLIAACESSAWLAAFAEMTTPSSFRDGCDVISQNVLRSHPPRSLLPLDRQVLWLATLIVMASAALVVVPIFAVVSRTHGLAVGWLACSLWPLFPAIAIFVPKSDVVYAFMGMMIVWAWLAGSDRRSLTIAALSGLLAWCGLMCSLAFLPVFLFAALASLRLGHRSKQSLHDSVKLQVSQGLREIGRSDVSCWRMFPPWRCILAAAVGFLGPLLAMNFWGHANLIEIWRLNYQNHAGFYEVSVRTYWKWVLFNPMELVFSVGCPIAVVTVWSLVSQISGSRSDLRSSQERTDPLTQLAAVLMVWGALWLTGKNSGEAARLWIIFMPWLALLAGPCLARVEGAADNALWRPAWIVLAIQLLICILTVTRVSGFHLDGS